MPAKRQLTWHATNRWRKRYRLPSGEWKDFYFREPNSERGYRAALKAWKAKLKEIAGLREERRDRKLAKKAAMLPDALSERAKLLFNNHLKGQ